MWVGPHSADAGVDSREVTRSEKRILGTFAYSPQDFRDGAGLAPAVETSWLEVAALADGVAVWEPLLAGRRGCPRRSSCRLDPRWVAVGCNVGM